MKTTTFPVFPLVFALLVLSCATSPREEANTEPEWLTTPPADPAWYYGIGTANTGDETKDRESAMVNARVELAASISVDVVSVLESSESWSSDGASRENVEKRVRQSVEQSLVNVETVETWFGGDRGYWVLLRMDREEWEALRRADRRASVPPPGGLDDLAGLSVSFQTVLSEKKLPLKLLPGGKNTPFEVSLDWNVSDYPVLDDMGGIHFSKVSGIVSFKHYGILLYSKEYGPVKEGGLDYGQARERAAVKILEAFRSDEAFADEVAVRIPEA